MQSPDFNKYHLPLKDQVAFEITIPKGYRGAAYLADYSFSGFLNYEDQILINRNCKFKINNVRKEGKINIFDVILVQ